MNNIKELKRLRQYLEASRDISMVEKNVTDPNSWGEGYAVGAMSAYEDAVQRLEIIIKKMADMDKQP